MEAGDCSAATLHLDLCIAALLLNNEDMWQIPAARPGRAVDSRQRAQPGPIVSMHGAAASCKS